MSDLLLSDGSVVYDMPLLAYVQGKLRFRQKEKTMSVVTGVTLISQCCDSSEKGIESLVRKLNEWIENDSVCGGGQLVRVDDHYGSTKHPECHVWGGGFDYLSWQEFICYAKSLPWRETVTIPDEESVILVVSPDQRVAEVHVLTEVGVSQSGDR